MDTISAWDIYWVMQLDSIVGTFEWMAWMSALAALGVGFVHVLSDGDHGSWRTVKIAAILSISSAFATAFIPSTKTAATMIVIPAIANNEAIQREAGDLYKIAKDGLRELVKPEPAEKVENEARR